MSAIQTSIGYLIDFTTRNLRRYAANEFKKQGLDITMDQWAILNVTKDNQGISHLTLLSQVLAKDPPTLTKMIDLLCKKGYLERQLNPKDRRKWDVVITKNGIKAEANAFALVKKIRTEINSAISEEEITQLKAILHKINRSSEKDFNAHE